METVAQAVNCGFGWVIVILALVGYFLTQKRLGQKWVFWIVLAAGWGFFALANTLLVAGVNTDRMVVLAIWLSSFVLVVVSMALLFLKLIQQTKPR